MASEFSLDPVNSSHNSPLHRQTEGRKSWAELRDVVRDTRKLVSSLASRVPSCFKFRTEETPEGKITRLYFLGIPPKNRENTLLYVNVPTSPMGITPTLTWCQLLGTFQTMLPLGQMSKEEQLLRERKRMGKYGITSYDLVESEGKFVFPACNSLFVCTDDNLRNEEPIFPYNIDISQEGARMDPQVCPSNSDLLASVCKICPNYNIDTSQEGARMDPQVCPRNSDLLAFVCKNEEPIFPYNIDTSQEGARMDPQVCPSNSDLLAFVCNNDLWVVNMKTCQEVRLTHSHKGDESLASDPISSGVPSFVVQEEFDRYTGYWWEPAGCQGDNDDAMAIEKTYRILFEEVDESGVEILQIFSPIEEKGVDEYRYPRPGTTNAKSSLKMVEFTVIQDGHVSHISENVIVKSLYEPLQFLFPSMEYLVRAGWTPCGKFVYVQNLNRKQSYLTLALIPVECFVAMTTDDEDLPSIDKIKYPPIHVIYEDTSEIWVNVHDILHFLPSTNENEIVFLWASEKSGFRHLYHVTSTLSRQPTIEDQEDIFETHKDVWKCSCITEQAVTSGNWEVSGKEIWVDTARQLVYFIGTKDTPLESHLYAVSYSNPSDVVRLTETGYSHCVAFSKDCSLFVTVYSSVQSTPMSTLHQIEHVGGQKIQTKPLGILMPSAPCPDYKAPELFSYEGKCGYTMHGMYYRPHNLESGRKYPTVLFVYGGPHVQLVTNSFKGLKFLRLHTLASQGYAVVVIDGRGSTCRGLAFESHLKNKMGVSEIEDQVEGLQHLASKVDFIDLNRVAIHGWSYGGYLSLMGLVQRPDVFKVAIAGAPVVNWQLYDTGYTERYMDLPEKNQVGYQEGNVLHYLDNFPDEENRLLIVHGLIDENVHFQHTSVLVNGLVRACKPHQLQVYPNERHGIKNHEANEHYKTMVLNFLQNNL